MHTHIQTCTCTRMHTCSPSLLCLLSRPSPCLVLCFVAGAWTWPSISVCWTLLSSPPAPLFCPLATPGWPSPCPRWPLSQPALHAGRKLGYTPGLGRSGLLMAGGQEALSLEGCWTAPFTTGQGSPKQSHVPSFTLSTSGLYIEILTLTAMALGGGACGR